MLNADEARERSHAARAKQNRGDEEAIARKAADKEARSMLREVMKDIGAACRRGETAICVPAEQDVTEALSRILRPEGYRVAFIASHEYQNVAEIAW